MGKRAISIYLISELNKLLEISLYYFQTGLTTCTSMDEEQRAMLRDCYCLVVIHTSVLTMELALESVSRMRLDNLCADLYACAHRGRRTVPKPGADMCLSDAAQPKSVIFHALVLVRQYTLYNHYDETKPEDAVTHRGNLIIDPIRRRVTLSDEEIYLQLREFCLIHHFARNPGIVVTQDQDM